MCWMLGIGEVLKPTEPTDPASLPTFRHVLKPGAVTLIGSAALRERGEVEDACRQFVLILSMLRESRVPPPAGEIVRRIHVRTLTAAGLGVPEDDVDRAARSVADMTSEDRARMAGAYVVRRLAAEWHLKGRGGYFA
jgi:hypothetical protein